MHDFPPLNVQDLVYMLSQRLIILWCCTQLCGALWLADTWTVGSVLEATGQAMLGHGTVAHADRTPESANQESPLILPRSSWTLNDVRSS